MDKAAIDKARGIIRTRLFSINPDWTADEGGGGFLSKESTPQNRKEAYSMVKDLLRDSIVGGLGSSVLIQGPSGSGKTWLVNEVLKSLDSDPRCKGNYLLVRLDGLVHTDDYQALLDIAAQLDIDHNLEEDVQIPFAVALNMLLEALRNGDRAKIGIVFVIDRFELFAKHKNQVLLYNLFDLAQIRCNPIAVIGLTCNMDAGAMLEKRVKSRFSHRKINLFLNYAFEDYLKIFKSFITLPRDFGDKKFLAKWKRRVDELMGNQEVLEALRSLHSFSASIKEMKKLLTVPVSSLSVRHPFLVPSDVSRATNVPQKPSLKAPPTGNSLLNLSIVELTLLVAMKRLSELDAEGQFNFLMVYNEYQKFVRQFSANLLSKSMAMKAFERLIHFHLVAPTSGWTSPAFFHQRGGASKEHRMVKLMVSTDQVKEAVKSHPNCPTDLARWTLQLSIR